MFAEIMENNLLREEWHEGNILEACGTASQLLEDAKYLKREGFSVDIADTIEDAKEKIGQKAPDLIICDAEMPDGSGIGFCHEDCEKSIIPVILVSDPTNEHELAERLGIGADDCITRPYTPEFLCAHIRARLRDRKRYSCRCDLPPMQIDILHGVVRIYGREIPLTRKEMSLLIFFIENKGRAMPQEELYENVWGDPPQTMGNTVKMHISRLRQKLFNKDNPFELAFEGNNYIFRQRDARPGTFHAHQEDLAMYAEL
jgi:DNA-binding response OmpR family regulator